MKLERFPAMVYRLALWTIHTSRTSVMLDDGPSLVSVMEEKFSARVKNFIACIDKFGRTILAQPG
ncbi:hypothetical protein DSO57_1002411 [Entomophthora muscae]|uniref:Uncharacterized protein n=1 Tax=Entomophthora muscae TaxID=34485 RepID=A0ACC2SAT9_9FUNG|nr:hypothetical protein DSO57_1002411 [Entomophthora muscae]